MLDSIEQLRAALLDGLPRLAMALAVLLAFWILARVLRALILRLGRRTHPDQGDVFGLLAQIASVLSVLMGVVTALGTLGVNVAALVASLGLAGFALGYALKDALSNLLAGVMLLLHRPFRTGDWISVDDYQGLVSNIDLRYTTLLSDGDTILVPNAILFTKSIRIRKPEPGIGE